MQREGGGRDRDGGETRGEEVTEHYLSISSEQSMQYVKPYLGQRSAYHNHNASKAHAHMRPLVSGCAWGPRQIPP